jgi:UDP-N-acetylmuramoylalanine--D-glutamate ligase
VVVVEVSSFQLDTIDTFKPKVGILLNITDDHLDRYDNLEAYAASKERIFQNQGPEDFAILNQSDPFTAGISNRIKSKKWLFDIKNEDREGAKIFPDKILFCINKTRKESIDIKDITLFGKHNLENISAAGLAALAVGGTIKGIRHAVKEFKGLSHRLEYVDEICGVKFFDDSKGTNVDAVRKAVLSFGNPIVLIMGGRDKGGLFHTLKDCVKNRVKKLIVMGEAKDIIASALNGSSPLAFAEDMEDAVLSAYKAASTGDIVLLSPGCASFDMYENYAKRGESFCNAVKNIRLKNR